MDNLGQQTPHQNNHSNDAEMNNFMDVSRMSSMWPYPHPERFPQYRDFFHEPTSQQGVVSGSETTNNVSQVLTNNSTQQHTMVNTVPVMGTLQTVLTQGLPNQSVNANVVNLNHTPLTLPNTIQTSLSSLPNATNSTGQGQEQSTQILTRMRLQDLVREVDPNEQLDEDVEDVLLQMADDFVDSAITAGCLLAKHRKSSTVEVKDLQLHLERNWNMWIPGFGTDELRPYKRASVTEAHKQRLTLIRKTLKKY
ncbi:transcription initiation factor TFIID subunit 12 isoform X2 [Halyomorpha halys]|uniref:transcription initiation factor TFIID subunit 12 isoform X2 n=1 Tax=Halyomorpha halys TaxID=286706 RepID=UPI0034D170C2